MVVKKRKRGRRRGADGKYGRNGTYGTETPRAVREIIVVPTAGFAGRVVRADWSRKAGRATSAWVSPGSAGVRRGDLVAPGFRHAEGFGDTRMYSCIMWSRIENSKRIVKWLSRRWKL
jgi:hypothetical protein